MPIPIPKGQNITIQKNQRSSEYCMPSMEVSDHFDLSYIISGDRKVITPLSSISYHGGDVATGIPYLYHRTVSQSDAPYENYLIKYTADFAKPFIENVGKNIFDKINNQRICRFSPPVSKKIKLMFEDMLEIYEGSAAYKEFILQGMLFRLLTAIYENRLETEISTYKSPLSQPVIDTIYYIENNYARHLTLENAAEKAHFSCSHFSRLFSSQLGMSFSEYLINVRIDHAKKILLQTQKPISVIAVETGFSSGDYFSAAFKRKTGMTPLEFRKTGASQKNPDS